jgi:multidrug efflux system membrane fusion protein
LIKDRANLANAELDLRRYRILATENSIALQQVDTQAALVQQLQGVVKTDEAAVQNAELNVANCRIVSPINGRTGLRQIDIGNIVQPGAQNTIVVVTQMQPISAIFTIPQDAFEQVRSALRGGVVPVYASTTDGTTQLDTGTLLTLDNEIDQNTGTVRLKATFPNGALTLWPGEFINTRVLVRTERGVVTVPRVAVQQGPTGPYVFVVGPDDRAEQRPVRTGITENGITVIADGIKAGERVVTDGQFRLVNGSRVSLAPMLVARAHP